MHCHRYCCHRYCALSPLLRFLEDRHLLARHAEDFEEFVVERLGVPWDYGITVITVTVHLIN
jgi:hypothetical protein